MFGLSMILSSAPSAEGEAVLEPGRYLYARLLRAYELEGNAAAWLMFGMVLLCMISAYLIGSLNPSIIFSRLFYKEDIRSYGSGNAGTTNTLRTYGPKMAALIFFLDLFKAAVAVVIGALLLSKTVGGAISALFAVLGHTFPIYYKFKGGKGAASTAMIAILLSPVTGALILVIFALIVLLTRYISLGSIIGAMLLPFLNYIFYPQNGMITLAYLVIMMIIIFMHRENIKRLLEGKESKISFKKTDKHKASEHTATDNDTSKKASEGFEKQETVGGETGYESKNFVKCPCGRLIPKSREKCAYCGKINTQYAPKSGSEKEKK